MQINPKQPKSLHSSMSWREVMNMVLQLQPWSQLMLMPLGGSQGEDLGLQEQPEPPSLPCQLTTKQPFPNTTYCNRKPSPPLSCGSVSRTSPTSLSPLPPSKQQRLTPSLFSSCRTKSPNVILESQNTPTTVNQISNNLKMSSCLPVLLNYFSIVPPLPPCYI